MRNLYYIIALIFLLCSCETREDINKTRNTSPLLFVGIENNDVNFVEISDTLKNFDSSVYYYKSSDDSNLNLAHTVELEFIGDNSVIKDSVNVSINEITNEIEVKTLLNSKTTNSTYHFNVYIIATDIYGLTSRAKISISIIGNRPPIPQCVFNKISNTEYEISAKNSRDLDGESIISYEYLIDGKIIYNKPGYEGVYETVANPNPGHAGSGGTYIISTPLSSIKHNFQVENVSDFKVYIRVKDERGLWSAWYEFRL